MSLSFLPAFSIGLKATCGTNSFRHIMTPYWKNYVVQGPVVQNNVSLKSSLRGQLIKCFTTL